jgi:D-3-phosphoglycerate dehydrogenase
VPGGNADAVAEATVGLMLATLRRVPEVHRLVVTGGYAARFKLQFGQLFGRTLGLVGIGNIGARVARICAGGFRMRVLAYDPGLSATAIAERGAEKVADLPSLLAAADIVSLHLPLGETTRHLIGRAELAGMKPSAILVNAARGPLVDETALAAALRDGQIAGAGLDVLEVEPPLPDNPLFAAPNVVLSPHTAGNTVEAARQLALASAEIVIAVLSGKKPEGLLNPEVWDRRRR